MYWRKFQRISISTHSLSRRLTHTCVRCSMRHWHFNSQPLKEADNSYTIEFCCLFYFNSQPLKEADPVVRLSVPALRHFNSQPLKEADMQQVLFIGA